VVCVDMEVFETCRNTPEEDDDGNSFTVLEDDN